MRLLMVALVGCAPAGFVERPDDDVDSADSAGPPPGPALTAYTVERSCALLDADPLYFEPADVVMWQAEICWTPDQPIPDYVPGYGRRATRCAPPVGGVTFVRDQEEAGEPQRVARMTFFECEPLPDEDDPIAWKANRIVRLTWLDYPSP